MHSGHFTTGAIVYSGRGGPEIAESIRSCFHDFKTSDPLLTVGEQPASVAWGYKRGSIKRYCLELSLWCDDDILYGVGLERIELLMGIRMPKPIRLSIAEPVSQIEFPEWPVVTWNMLNEAFSEAETINHKK